MESLVMGTSWFSSPETPRRLDAAVNDA